ncbi:MAG: type II toxin-antitoxin system RelE/ParE family toxin [Gammaproteobacteria bacterium]|nr:type II toxin-antitoxin system RelE/ParE family toxin [Gammaproteobacteria bacterium]
MKDIEYSRGAVRTLARMPRHRAISIRNKIRACAENPSSQANNVERLRGADGLLRLRVGDWRVIMRDAGRVQVLHIASRGGA